MNIANCKCGEKPKEVVSEMFRDCSNNYHIECLKCGNKSTVSNFSYYSPTDIQIENKMESINDWNNKQSR